MATETIHRASGIPLLFPLVLAGLMQPCWAQLTGSATPGPGAVQAPPAQPLPMACDYAGIPTQPQVFRHVWGGLVSNAFTLDGDEAWTVADGGRIRHTTQGGPPAQAWASQTTPFEVQDILRNVFFLDSSQGWAVGRSGWVIATDDGGASWEYRQRQDSCSHYADLYDIHMMDAQKGWLMGEHEVRYTLDGGHCWMDVRVKENGQVIDPCAEELEFYSMDFHFVGSQFIGILAAEPGKIYRTDETTGGLVWNLVYDVCSDPFNPGINVPCDPGPCQWITTGNDELAKPELWDVDISEGSDLDNLTITTVGGIGNTCGFILTSGRSGDPGTWVQEFHECDPLGTGQGCIVPQCTQVVNGQHVDTLRHTSYRTLYGVAMAGDTSGIGCGYNGQHLYRNPGLPPQCWVDVSTFMPPPTPGFPIFPLNGADSDGGDLGSGKGWMVGFGNLVRRTTDGGLSYVDQAFAEATRVQDVFTTPDGQTAWYVAQFLRIHRSDDGGVTWDLQHVASGPSLQGIAVNTDNIALDPDDLPGVAVGPSALGTTVATLVRTVDGGQDGWTQLVTLPLEVDGEILNAVAYAGSSTFYAAGSGSLLIRSTDDGATWETISVPLAGFTINDVAFKNADTGLIVGQAAGDGRAFAISNATTASPVFTDFTPNDPSLDVKNIRGVGMVGGTFYACGSQRIAGQTDPASVVLKWDPAIEPRRFIADTSAPDVPFRDDEDTQVSKWEDILNTVEVTPDTQEVFIGGSFGRILHLDGSGWQFHKSDTSNHILGMHFPSSAQGYVTGFAQGHTAIVRYFP